MAEAPAIPPEERLIGESGARRLTRVLRERWQIIVISTAAALAVALIYVSVATPTYQAEAQLLISPVTDPNLDVLSLLRASSDPSNDTQTAALLVSTPEVAAEARRILRSRKSPRALLSRVEATPIAGSDVVAVTADASTAAAAARLANAFARAATVVRTRLLQAQLRTAIPRLQAEISASPAATSATTTNALTSQLAVLLALQGEPDPTIQLGSAAVSPTSRAAPRTALSLAAGGILGLAIGIAIALVADMRDPQLRRESQLQETLDLPVLARLPWVPAEGQERSDLDPAQLESVFNGQEFLAEATGSLERSSGDQKQAIVFTSTDSQASSTFVALNHARLLASAGQHVILVDGDPRAPAVGRATGAQPSPQVEQVLAGSHPIGEALVYVDDDVKLRVFAVDEAPNHGLPVRLPMGRRMLAKLRRVADTVVVAAPPLDASPRALALARSADRVVVVVQIGRTRLAQLRELAELFARHGVRGAGIVLIAERDGSGDRDRYRTWLELVVQHTSWFRPGSAEEEGRATGEADTEAGRGGADGAAQSSRHLPNGREPIGRP